MAELTYRDAVIRGIAQEMERDPDVVFLGEDVAKPGGVFKATVGLYEQFGPLRVRDTPISEQAIMGAAMGAAMTGLKPIAEIMFSDFFAVCFDYIANEFPKSRYMSNGQVKCPLVVRTGNGAGSRFGAQHSQSVENWCMMIPGLKVVAPSSPVDVIGLLAASVRDPDPVIFLEHKSLYATKGEVPDGEIVDTLGTAKILRPGKDATILALALMVPRALEAAETLKAEHGIDCEVVDVRSLVPLDTQTILGSVAKTHRLFTVEENPRLCGWGAEIVSIVADEAFYDLDGPPVRITTPHIPLPAADTLEDIVLPTPQRIAETVRRSLEVSSRSSPRKRGPSGPRQWVPADAPGKPHDGASGGLLMYENLLANVPTDLWIGGKWRKASDNARFDVIDPATERTIASVASATVDDAKAALDAAEAAFEGWAGAQAARARRDPAQMLRADHARRRALRQADHAGERQGAARLARRGGLCRRILPLVRRGSRAQSSATSRCAPASGARILAHHKPAGIAVLVTPWNFPAAMATRKIGPALAAGCPVVLEARFRHAAHHAGADAGAGRSRRAGRRGQRHPLALVRQGGQRHAARSARARGLLHRLDRSRPQAAARGRRQHPQAGDGAGRQRALHRVRGRRYRRGHRRRHGRQDAQHGRGLHGGQPLLCAREGARRICQEAHRQDGRR